MVASGSTLAPPQWLDIPGPYSHGDTSLADTCSLRAVVRVGAQLLETSVPAAARCSFIGV